MWQLPELRLRIPPRTRKIDALMLGTYVNSRLGMAGIALALPIMLWLGGRFVYGIPFGESMSAYYHLNDGAMRNWFVGALWAVGACLFFHQGYSGTETRLLKVAGVLAVCIAMFPMAWECGGRCAVPSTCGQPCPQFPQLSRLHFPSAIGFFFCLALVSWRCRSQSLRLVQYENRRWFYSRVYKWLAWLMVLFPVIAFVLATVTAQKNRVVFIAELVGIVVFASFWIAKTCELWRTALEKRAAQRRSNVTLEEEVEPPSRGTSVPVDV